MKKKIHLIFLTSLVVLFFVYCVIGICLVSRKYKNYVVAYSEEFGLDSSLVYAIIKVESDYKKDAVSKSGALGLMQILPSTA